MSHSVHSCVVPFVVRSFFVGSLSEVDEDKTLSFLCNPDGVLAEETQWDVCDGLELNGWSHTTYLALGDMQLGDDMVTNHWVKGDHHVFLLNESGFSNVSEYDMSVVAHDEASIRVFCKDINIDANIQNNVIVHSWW